MTKQKPEPTVQHCDCHVIAQADLRDAIYWLLRVLPHEYPSIWIAPTEAQAFKWLCNHGYDPASPKAKRLMARKRVPR
jgi:hypothetical protein